MASQRVFVLAIAGPFADEVWSSMCRWSDSRRTDDPECWDSADWPVDVQAEIDRAVGKLIAHGFTPPILYRSEHVDLWLMGGDFEAAIGDGGSRECRQVLTPSYEVMAAWIESSERFAPHKTAPGESKWFYSRMNEAASAWAGLVDKRLMIVIRSVLSGFWTDDEIQHTVGTIPAWWTETD